MWFDVEMIRYTTLNQSVKILLGLWFDVEMIRYTTMYYASKTTQRLWFDVEMIRYTTQEELLEQQLGCGLM